MSGSFRCKGCHKDVYHATLLDNRCPVCIKDSHHTIDCAECGEFCGYASGLVTMVCATCFEAAEEDYKASQKRHRKKK